MEQAMEQAIDLEAWPPLEGRYVVGNKKSAVAVCTNATVKGINLDMAEVAICGKCVTENIGIEKMIQNIVSNPYLRFLILCGKVSKGHFVEQAVMSLKENGIDKQKRIIGAKGNMPYLKGLDEDFIQRFRQQIIPINLQGETDPQKIMQTTKQCLTKNPGAFKGTQVEIEKVREVKAIACRDWIADPKGFFTILIDQSDRKIMVEHYQESVLKNKIVGESAEDIGKAIANLELIGQFQQTLEHAMYLARELQKAEIALRYSLPYEQDAELKITKVEAKKQMPSNTDEYGWYD